ncbi:MAG: hypothetical protein SGILL_000406 [Bacillariaceae sp.]
MRETSSNKLKQLAQEDEDNSNASAFYLKHQNRALASELRSVKYQLSRLERERDFRRSQCSDSVQSINALESIWGQLESSLGGTASSRTNTKSCGGIKTDAAPLSTGSGSSVEMIGVFMESLARLGSSANAKIKGADNGQGEEKSIADKGEDLMDVDEDPQAGEVRREKEDLKQLTQVTESISERAALLQSWIWSLLQKVDKTQLLTNGETMTPPSSMELQEKVIRLEAENASLQERVQEVARSRDEIVESDRRVRRGLYRLAAGRQELKDVLKAVASADQDKEAAAAWMEASAAPVLGASASSSTAVKAAAEKVKSDDDTEKQVSSEEVTQLKKQIADLTEVAAARDDQIKQLLTEREGQLKRINSLMLEDKKPSSDAPTTQELQQSDLYLELSTKLADSERKLEDLEDKTNRIKGEWSTALANAELSKKTMEDLQAKHLKRWAELAADHPDIGPAAEGGEASGVSKAEEIIALQHKLTQALENVRQAESTRSTLNEAVALNESLQARADEFKSKYVALQAEKADSANSANGTGPDASTDKSESSQVAEKSERSAEKLHRDYKRARKELAAATASKEAAKARLERAEKEKDFFNQANIRLMKQAAEKDEINAKSLSTILHLKQLTEQISKEKDNLEQQVKSAEQLALAARLASNARDRVAEEFEKERKVLADQVKQWEQKCTSLAQEKALAEGKLTQEKARMSKLIGDAHKAKERCDELTSESTKLQEEKQKMMESLAVAQREATDAATFTQQLAESQGGGMVAGFTAEQLNTQVKVLKNRLTCPVCNARDKKCILLRCRHMFCKQCVDENVKNRSRKCPACGQRFDTKDIADVWL